MKYLNFHLYLDGVIHVDQQIYHIIIRDICKDESLEGARAEFFLGPMVVLKRL